ncbi:MAG: (5-formylfuran-3-yl)methyl phosphate synthase [Lentisphaeria bacterium]|nr:(5-formylfuran-3-yl)methyl phosphate synthase [Lentisphaeria bacterium]
MKLLISPICIEEARIAFRGGCDIVDIKNVAEGSLGAQPPWVTEAIVSELAPLGATVSVALGDLPNKPGTAGLAAYAAARLGVHYIKAGLYGATNYSDALAMMASVTRSIRMVRKDILAVACGYADYRRFGGVPCDELVDAAGEAGADVVMVDTAVKDGKTLFDALRVDEIQRFVERGHEAGMMVALAGSIGLDHIETLCAIGPDIIGVRGAVCDGSDRRKQMSVRRIQELALRLRERSGAAAPVPMAQAACAAAN